MVVDRFMEKAPMIVPAHVTLQPFPLRSRVYLPVFEFDIIYLLQEQNVGSF